MIPRTRVGALGEDERGASEVVGVALLIGFVLLGVTALLLIGSPQYGEAQESVEVGQAEQALVQFDSEAARIATGGTTTQRLDLGLRANEGTLEVANDSGRITVERVNVSENGSTVVLLNDSLGSVVYENGETSVAYQGGGVWRSDGNGSTMVSPPEIAFRGKTLSMPVVRVRGDSVYSEVQVVRASSRERFPNASAGLTNKVRNSKIRVTIQSRYYRAWGAYFEDETGVIVQYDDAQRKVTLLFLALPENFAPDAGIIATSGPGELRLGSSSSFVDSYNSSQGPYSTSSSGNGTVEAAGNVIMEGGSEIQGDVNGGKDIELQGTAKIEGDARANGTVIKDADSTVTGDIVNNSSPVAYRPPIDELVMDKTENLENENDNNQTPVIENEELNVTATDNSLEPGEYYLDRFELEGEELVLNVTSGNITIAVREWMLVTKDGGVNSRIDVEGNGTVRIFVASEQKTSVNPPGAGNEIDKAHFYIERDAEIEVDGQESPRVQIYGPDNFAGAIAGSNSEQPNVTATIYAPAGTFGSGKFYIKNADLYGAVATGNLTLGTKGEVHFDRALLNSSLPLAPNVPRLDYLYLTEYELLVERS